MGCWLDQYQDMDYTSLKRDLGKEAALLAGLQQHARAIAVIVTDSDLQHPAKLISQMVHLWRSGRMWLKHVNLRAVGRVSLKISG